ncbi:hypothetical protein OCI51_27360 (plasmid) [Lysinibacillus capsici]|uniref:hypothetical protein n=1 Tax=Lysinibacillus capsici TaxID=2115968 RepID=UPI0021D9FD3E|nr:hypothetical protein [Lysinibacillus capsici]UYB50292.1 hypothetical protein OCI51_27360 [Lysinibacillus capsici]
MGIFSIRPGHFVAAERWPKAVLPVPGSFSIRFSCQQALPYDPPDLAIAVSAAVASAAAGR